MRRRLIVCLLLWSSCIASAKANVDAEQDLAVGRFIFQLMDAMQKIPDADQQMRSTLGSAVEFSFLQLQRSRSVASVIAVAETIVLDIDAGGGTSQQDAILAKPLSVVAALRSAVDRYDKLCVVGRAKCADRDFVRKRAEKLIAVIQDRDRSPKRIREKPA